MAAKVAVGALAEGVAVVAAAKRAVEAVEEAVLGCREIFSHAKVRKLCSQTSKTYLAQT